MSSLSTKNDLDDEPRFAIWKKIYFLKGNAKRLCRLFNEKSEIWFGATSVGAKIGTKSTPFWVTTLEKSSFGLFWAFSPTVQGDVSMYENGFKLNQEQKLRFNNESVHILYDGCSTSKEPIDQAYHKEV